ncbi:hypothetical protein QJS10_CPA06g01390 [Acorus calamus]|uniref:Uncharacterized protein n=1 Tax=Acorus calamus TaxID=4465 RepID=A0AAV9ENK3_ACOCL|nr:hypothetical protein QJS10_CPA06g01390 [Acorus calamus]
MALLFKPMCRALSPPPKPTSKSSLMAARASFSKVQSHRKLPILLFDVMDTLVRDPFYEDIPAFFRMPMKELLEAKHPTAWVEFEKGLINETELTKKFFKDGRHFDLEGKRKPEADSYKEVLHHLGVEPSSCVFIDDRIANVEAAQNAGMVGIHFKNAVSLGERLSSLGINTSCETNRTTGDDESIV